MKKKVSVIVPVYNVEKFLKKCIDSILNQTYTNLELILVDDGSTDGSALICDQYSNNEKVIVIHKKNGGLSSARNSGLDVATGDYISFIDSDDFIENDMYENMVNALEKSNKDIACCGRIVDVYGTHENKEFILESEKEYSNKEAIKKVLHLSEIDVSACDKLYKKKIFDNLRYPVGKISEDSAVIMELLDSSNGVIHVGKPYYHYVFRRKSISKSNYSLKNLDILENLKNTEHFIQEKYSDLINDFKIYACLTASAQLILINDDKQAKKRFKTEYLCLKKFFNNGYKLTKNSSDISKKKKIELIFIRYNLYSMYKLIKKIYQLKYKIIK